MPKRVSNKAHGGGARSVRTHATYMQRRTTRKQARAAARAIELQQRANHFHAHIAAQPKSRPTLMQRARMFVRRVVGV